MKRAAFQFCANVDPERYKVLTRRDQLPYLDYPSKTEFTISHAFRLRLALDLIGGEAKDRTQLQGLNPDYASSIVLNVARAGWPLADDEDLTSIAEQDLWAGLVVLEFKPMDADSYPEDAHQPEGYRWSKWFVGELESLPSFVAETKKEESAPGKVETVRLFLADASACARGVLRRAEELGIEN